VADLARTITVEHVDEKTGTTNGRDWKVYKIKSEDGAFFATFDGTMGSNAKAAQGRRAHITYTSTEKGNNLVSFVVDESSQAPVEPVRDRTDGDEPDWDLIGLRKTRCALWAAAIGASFENGGFDADVCHQIVLAAEVDIFHRAPATATSDIPF
jgi:hypothetical protein